MSSVHSSKWASPAEEGYRCSLPAGRDLAAAICLLLDRASSDLACPPALLSPSTITHLIALNRVSSLLVLLCLQISTLRNHPLAVDDRQCSRDAWVDARTISRLVLACIYAALNACFSRAPLYLYRWLNGAAAICTTHCRYSPLGLGAVLYAARLRLVRDASPDHDYLATYAAIVLYHRNLCRRICDMPVC